MIYLGHTEGIKASLFMRLPNNTLYTNATDLYDETLYPKCDKACTKGTTRINEPREELPQQPVEDTIPGVDDPFPTIKSEDDEQPIQAPEEEECEQTPVPPTLSPPPVEEPVPLRSLSG